MLLKYAAGSKAGSGALGTGISGIETGGIVNPFGGLADLSEELEFRVLLEEP